jgi:hypothetical protein
MSAITIKIDHDYDQDQDYDREKKSPALIAGLGYIAFLMVEESLSCLSPAGCDNFSHNLQI